MIFAKPQLLLWAGNKITDHNRSELSIDIERIENSKRMANGTLRKYVVADKRTFSCSWDMLPARAAKTVDNFWGALDMEDFYNVTAGAFLLQLNYGSQNPEVHNVVFTNFSATLQKRGAFDFYQVDVELTEV